MLICIFLLLPFINLIFYFILCLAWFRIFKNLYIHRDNLDKVPDPLKNMVYSPEICLMMQ